MSLIPVQITGTGSFLPGLPVTNDRLDAVLGAVDDAPAYVQNFVNTLGPKMLERGGIRARHFAIDPETGDMTYNFSSLAEQAARNALVMAEMAPQDLDLIVLSCPAYDQGTPPTSALLQERLGAEHCAEIEVHSNCSGVGKCVQIAYDALRTGRYRSALVAYAQLSSFSARACYFNQAKMDKVHAALRWILADGAGALVLQAVPNGLPDREIVGTFVESVGADRPAGMTSGRGMSELMKASYQLPDAYDDGTHHLWQDFSAVNKDAAPLLLQGLCKFAQQLEIDPSEVDHYIVSIPTRRFYEDHISSFLDRLSITRDKLKFRSDNIGYCGGATPLIHLDEMVRNGELKSGQLAIVHAVESSKWMTAGFAVRW